MEVHSRSSVAGTLSKKQQGTLTSKHRRNDAVGRSVERRDRVHLAVEPSVVAGAPPSPQTSSFSGLPHLFLSHSPRPREGRLCNIIHFLQEKLTSTPNGGSRQASGLHRPPTTMRQTDTVRQHAFLPERAGVVTNALPRYRLVNTSRAPSFGHGSYMLRRISLQRSIRASINNNDTDRTKGHF